MKRISKKVIPKKVSRLSSINFIIDNFLEDYYWKNFIEIKDLLIKEMDEYAAIAV